MAASPLLQHSNQVTSSVSHKIHGSSKTHSCLKKIIHIISSHSSLQPCEIVNGSSMNPKVESEAIGSGEKHRTLLDFDLNLILGSSPETVESEEPTENRGLSACSGVGDADGKDCRIVIDCNSDAVSCDVSTADKSFEGEGECDPKEYENSFDANKSEVEEEEHELVEEETKEFSEITNLQVSTSEIDNKQVYEESDDGEQSEIKAEVEKQQEEEEKEEKGLQRSEYKSEGYLGLLIEAARLISGNFEEEEPEPEMNESTRCGSKRNQCWMLDYYGGFEDISPVVRSTRGRNQVLPYRYRDSVLEPWKRLTRQRSTRVSNKQKPI